MSVCQEREEVVGHSQTCTPESNVKDKKTDGFSAYCDTVAQTPRAPSPVASCVSLKSDVSLPYLPPKISKDPVSPHPPVQTPRAPSPVPSCVSLKSDGSLPYLPPKISKDPISPHPLAQTPRAPSPVASCVSMKSDGSLPYLPPKISKDPASPHPPAQTPRAPSPVPSCVSLKSDGSLPYLPPKISKDPVSPHPPVQTPRAPSPVVSCVSLKSDGSLPYLPPKISKEPVSPHPLVQTPRAPSPVPSCVSLKSDGSLPYLPPKISKDPVSPHPPAQTPRAPSPVVSCVSLKSDGSLPYLPPKISKDPVSPHPPLTQRRSSCEQVLRDTAITSCGHQSQRVAEQLRTVMTDHKFRMKRRVEKISEGMVTSGAETLLNEIYTELYITKGESEGVNKDHEVRQLESISRPQTIEDTPINCNDIFKPLPGEERNIKTVMTKGVAGIGKTVSVQKFILDWTHGVANQNVDFIFPLPFRGLNLIRRNQNSLHRLLLEFHPELEKLQHGDTYKDCQILFIFDGLDESRLNLEFGGNINCCDENQMSSVDVLISSLIQGSLLPSALIWITSRPAAASQVPGKYIDQVTEVRGFNDPQKDKYFRKRISDESLSSRIISHVKASRSLYIMCHIPVFCWIAATVLHQMLKDKNIRRIPKTLTEMFIHFLLIQTARGDEKYHNKTAYQGELLESQKDIILKLAELAFKNLESGNLMFYEEDLQECDIDVSEASVYSGLCTEIFKEESLFHQKVYCFVHLSIQEFLAAFYAFHSFVTGHFEALQSVLNEKYTCDSQPSPWPSILSALGLKKGYPLHILLKSAVDESLKSRNGHLDLFLRFLMGISLERNQGLLKGLLTQTQRSSGSVKEVCRYIRNLEETEDLSAERCINLIHCLSEMGDQSMHKEIQKFRSAPKMAKRWLTPAHCSALAHMCLMSEEVLDEFFLKSYNTSDEGRKRLLPAVRCYRIARLGHCKLSKESCEILASALNSPNSLTELDLTDNDLGDSGFQILSRGLSSPYCRLQSLRLTACKLTEHSTEMLAPVLQLLNSLVELDLSDNTLGDSGVELLSNGLSSPHCRLQILRLSSCLISEKGCKYLAAALTSNPSHMKELDLNLNHPGESGQEILSARLEDPLCKLETLNTYHCSEIRLTADVRSYTCDLTLDPNTANRHLRIFESNRNVTYLSEKQPYPDHPDRFDYWKQVLCSEALSGRSYWEAEWSGYRARIAVAYKSIKRKGWADDVIVGGNDKSWSLSCSAMKYFVSHNKKDTDIRAPSSDSRRVGVYLDWPAGILSFYSVSSDNTLSRLHTFQSTFTEPLYPAFFLYNHSGSSVSLCQII